MTGGAGLVPPVRPGTGGTPHPTGAAKATQRNIPKGTTGKPITTGPAAGTAAPAARTTGAAAAIAAASPASQEGTLPPPPPLPQGPLDNVLIDENSKKSRRNRRSLLETDRIGVWDVKAQPITALEIDDDLPLPADMLKSKLQTTQTPVAAADVFCISSMSFGFMLAFTVMSSLITTMICLLICSRRPSMKMV